MCNPKVVAEAPLTLLATVLIIIGAKSLAAFGVMRMMGKDRGMGLTIAASLAQIGEFSFILIVMGVNLDIVPPEGRDLVVAGALLSILMNPMLFRLVARLEKCPPAVAAFCTVETSGSGVTRVLDPPRLH